MNAISSAILYVSLCHGGGGELQSIENSGWNVGVRGERMSFIIITHHHVNHIVFY